VKPLESPKIIDEQFSDAPINAKWNYEAALKTALKEREELLKTNPQLRWLQDEIDESLTSVDDFQERMQILGTMMGNKLGELHKECNKLAAICEDLDVDSNLPILNIKQNLINLKKIKNSLCVR